MRAVLDLHPRHVHAVDVPRVPEPSRIAVLFRFRDQADGDPSRTRRDHRVGVPLIGHAIHDHVDLLRFGVVVPDRAVGVRFRRDKQELRVLREDVVHTRARHRDVCVVAVRRRVRPEIVVLRPEAVDDRRVRREKDGLVRVVARGARARVVGALTRRTCA